MYFHCSNHVFRSSEIDIASCLYNNTKYCEKLHPKDFQLLCITAFASVLLTPLNLENFLNSTVQNLNICLCTPVVLEVVDIDPQGSIGPSKGSMNCHGVEWGLWMARGSMNNCWCWGLLEHWSLQFKIIVNRARNANGVFQQIKQN